MNIFRNHHQGYPNFHFKDRVLNFFKSNNPLNRLIAVNIGIYVLILGINILMNLFRFLQGMSADGSLDSFILEWFGVSSNVTTLLTRPWTMITSLFLHLDFFHIVFNMITLWFSGKIFLYFFPVKKIYAVYLLGGVMGNILFILSFHFFPVFASVSDSSVATGASGGVLAVLIAAASKSPNYLLRFFMLGNISLKWLAVFFLIVDIISIPRGNSGGHFAHLGGALLGFLYVYIPKWNQWIRLKATKIKKPKPHPSSRPKTDEQYNAERAAYRKKVDGILDKISKSGYQSLSKEEKEFLFRTSNKKNW
jgi:membrane associated rhomboid family serine protease